MKLAMKNYAFLYSFSIKQSRVYKMKEYVMRKFTRLAQESVCNQDCYWPPPSPPPILYKIKTFSFFLSLYIYDPFSEGHLWSMTQEGINQ